jgi:hypothetical protein
MLLRHWGARLATSFPIKVRSETYERIRLAAAVMNCSQTDLLEMAIDAYVEGKRGELEEGISRLQASLLTRGSKTARLPIRKRGPTTREVNGGISTER